MNSQSQPAKSPKFYLTCYLKRLEDERDRLRAWDYCYEAFQKVVNDTKTYPEEAFKDYTLKKADDEQSLEDQKKEECIDYLALHLGTLMAYWGMLRGNSFLHQTNYTVHKPIVLELLQPDYRALYGMGIDELQKDENVKLLCDLIKELKRIYKKELNSLLKTKTQQEPPDLVVTKVILGAMGCFPALDRFVVAALGQFKPRTPKASRKPTDDERAFCARRRELKAFKRVYDEFVYPALEEIRKDKENNYSKASGYPEMKYVDMYLWELGAKIIKDKEKDQKTPPKSQPKNKTS